MSEQQPKTRTVRLGETVEIVAKDRARIGRPSGGFSVVVAEGEKALYVADEIGTFTVEVDGVESTFKAV